MGENWRVLLISSLFSAEDRMFLIKRPLCQLSAGAKSKGVIFQVTLQLHSYHSNIHSDSLLLASVEKRVIWL